MGNIIHKIYCICNLYYPLLLLAAGKRPGVFRRGTRTGNLLEIAGRSGRSAGVKAQTGLLQSQLEYAQAEDELNEAIGQNANK